MSNEKSKKAIEDIRDKTKKALQDWNAGWNTPTSAEMMATPGPSTGGVYRTVSQVEKHSK